MTRFDYLMKIATPAALAELICEASDCSAEICPVFNKCSKGKNGIEAWLNEEDGTHPSLFFDEQE